MIALTAHDENLQHVYLPMRDGIRLSTYVKVPKKDGPWPVIFSRSPYPHTLSSWLKRAEFWTEQGYAFVLQECRGTGVSEGEWTPFVHEKNDGLDSLQWIIAQDWQNGRIGTYGSSYHGTIQWIMAEYLPPEVKTMFIGFAGIERYRQNYMNGMFRHDIYTVWALGNAGIKPLKPGPGLYREALSVRPHIEMDMRLFGQVLPWYRDWVTETDSTSPYWSSGLWAYLKDTPMKTTVPVMMTGGWFDHNLDASIQSYNNLPEAVRKESCFLIGPWVHTQDISGDLEYPDHDIWGPLQIKAALAWFDHHLKGNPLNVVKGSVHTYIIREGQWKVWDGWIRHNEIASFYLDISQAGGFALTTEKQISNETVSYKYDPKDPVPTKGGAGLMAYLSGDSDASRPASVIQDQLGTRPDVISFLSEQLKENLTITGSIQAQLFVSSDAEDTSFTATVMEQLADGTAYNIRDGISSLRYRYNRASSYRPGEIASIEIEMWPITWTLRKGSKLRVDISSSNFPAYHLHPNIADPWAYQDEMKAAKQTVFIGGDFPSRILLPVL